MKLLVTGANGFAGSHLLRALRERGHEAVGLVRREFSGFDPSRHRLWDGRILSDELLDGVEGVVHAAGAAHRPDAGAEFFEGGNRSLTLAVARAVEASEARLLIHLSSVAAEEGGARATSAYGRSKREAEEVVEALRGSGKLGVNLRPPLIYGPGAPGNWAKLVRLAHSSAPLPFAAVRNRRSYLGIENLASAVAAVLEVTSGDSSKSGNYVVADSAPLSLAEVVKVLREALGRHPGLVAFPPGVLNRGLRLFGKTAMADGLFGDLVLDSTPFREAFGWNPPQTSAEGMAASLLFRE